MTQIAELIIILYFLFIMGIFLLCMFFHCYRNMNITTIKTNRIYPIQETKENELKIETLTLNNNV